MNSKANRSKNKHSIAKKLKTESVKVSEQEWNIPPIPLKGLPEYKAENDRYCPKAQEKHWNKRNKEKASRYTEDKSLTSSKWTNDLLNQRYKNVPVPISIHSSNINAFNNGNYQNIASTNNINDSEILQQIVVREKLLLELKTLIGNQSSDLSYALNEIGELIRAIRIQTLEIIENIKLWQEKSSVLNEKTFLYRGCNYIVKISSDLDYLDNYDEIIEKFCFEFYNNPLAYRGGGNLIKFALDTPTNTNSNHFNSNEMYSTYLNEGVYVDGIETIRLRNAEKFIYREVEREKKGSKSLNNTTNTTYNNISARDEDMVKIGENSSEQGLSDGKDPFNNNMVKTDDLSEKPSPKRYLSKTKRLHQLREDIGELDAMQSHIDDQVQSFVSEYKTIDERKKYLDAKRNEIVKYGHAKESALHNVTVELSVINTELQSTNMKIKDLQRQNYFLSLEKRRKKLLLKKIDDEIKLERQKKIINQKVISTIKEQGIEKAIKLLSANAASLLSSSQLDSKASLPLLSKSASLNPAITLSIKSSTSVKGKSMFKKLLIESSSTMPERKLSSIKSTLKRLPSQEDSSSLKGEGFEVEKHAKIDDHHYTTTSEMPAIPNTAITESISRNDSSSHKLTKQASYHHPNLFSSFASAHQSSPSPMMIENHSPTSSVKQDISFTSPNITFVDSNVAKISTSNISVFDIETLRTVIVKYRQGLSYEAITLLKKSYIDYFIEIDTASQSWMKTYPKNPTVLQLMVSVIIGDVFMTFGQFNESKLYYDRCLNIINILFVDVIEAFIESQGHLNQRRLSYNGTSGSVSSQNAIHITTYQHFELICYVYKNIGRWFQIHCQFQEALKYLSKANSIMKIIVKQRVYDQMHSEEDNVVKPEGDISKLLVSNLVFTPQSLFLDILVEMSHVHYHLAQYAKFFELLHSIFLYIDHHHKFNQLDDISISNYLYVSVDYDLLQGNLNKAVENLHEVIRIRNLHLGSAHPYLLQAKIRLIKVMLMFNDQLNDILHLVNEIETLTLVKSNSLIQSNVLNLRVSSPKSTSPSARAANFSDFSPTLVVKSSSPTHVSQVTAISHEFYPDLYADLLFVKGKYYLETGNLTQSYHNYHECLLIRQHLFHPSNLVIYESFMSLCEYSLILGHYQHALVFYNNAVEILKGLALDYDSYEKKLNDFHEMMRDSKTKTLEEPPIHVNTIDQLLHSCQFLELKGNFQACSQQYEKSVKLLQLIGKQLELDHYLGLDQCLIQLAYVNTVLGHHDKVKPLLKHSMSIILDIFPPNHPIFSTRILILSQLCFYKGRYSDAKSLLDKSVDIFANHYKLDQDEDPRDYETNHLNLVIPTRAIPFNKSNSATDISQITDPMTSIKNPRYRNHYYLWQSLVYQCNHSRIFGQYEDAAENCDEILSCCIDFFSETGIKTALSLFTRAQIVRDLGLFHEANDLLLKSIQMIEREVGNDNGYFGLVLGEYGECLRLEGQYQDAKQAFDRALILRKLHFGDTHVYVDELLCNISAMMIDIGHYSSSELLLKSQVIPMLENKVGRKNPLTLYALGNLGICIKTRLDLLNSKDNTVNRSTYASSSQSVDSNAEKSFDKQYYLLHKVFNILVNDPLYAYPTNHPWITRFQSFLDSNTLSQLQNIDQLNTLTNDHQGSSNSSNDSLMDFKEYLAEDESKHRTKEGRKMNNKGRGLFNVIEYLDDLDGNDEDDDDEDDEDEEEEDEEDEDEEAEDDEFVKESEVGSQVESLQESEFESQLHSRVESQVDNVSVSSSQIEGSEVDSVAEAVAIHRDEASDIYQNADKVSGESSHSDIDRRRRRKSSSDKRTDRSVDKHIGRKNSHQSSCKSSRHIEYITIHTSSQITNSIQNNSQHAISATESVYEGRIGEEKGSIVSTKGNVINHGSSPSFELETSFYTQTDSHMKQNKSINSLNVDVSDMDAVREIQISPLTNRDEANVFFDQNLETGSNDQDTMSIAKDSELGIYIDESSSVNVDSIINYASNELNDQTEGEYHENQSMTLDSLTSFQGAYYDDFSSVTNQPVKVNENQHIEGSNNMDTAVGSNDELIEQDRDRSEETRMESVIEDSQNDKKNIVQVVETGETSDVTVAYNQDSLQSMNADEVAFLASDSCFDQYIQPVDATAYLQSKEAGIVGLTASVDTRPEDASISAEGYNDVSVDLLIQAVNTITIDDVGTVNEADLHSNPVASSTEVLFVDIYTLSQIQSIDEEAGTEGLDNVEVSSNIDADILTGSTAVDNNVILPLESTAVDSESTEAVGVNTTTDESFQHESSTKVALAVASSNETLFVDNNDVSQMQSTDEEVGTKVLDEIELSPDTLTGSTAVDNSVTLPIDSEAPEVADVNTTSVPESGTSDILTDSDGVTPNDSAVATSYSDVITASTLPDYCSLLETEMTNVNDGIESFSNNSSTTLAFDIGSSTMMSSSGNDIEASTLISDSVQDTDYDTVDHTDAVNSSAFSDDQIVDSSDGEITDVNINRDTLDSPDLDCTTSIAVGTESSDNNGFITSGYDTRDITVISPEYPVTSLNDDDPDGASVELADDSQLTDLNFNLNSSSDYNQEEWKEERKEETSNDSPVQDGYEVLAESNVTVSPSSVVPLVIRVTHVNSDSPPLKQNHRSRQNSRGSRTRSRSGSLSETKSRGNSPSRLASVAHSINSSQMSVRGSSVVDDFTVSGNASVTDASTYAITNDSESYIDDSTFSGTYSDSGSEYSYDDSESYSGSEYSDYSGSSYSSYSSTMTGNSSRSSLMTDSRIGSTRSSVSYSRHKEYKRRSSASLSVLPSLHQLIQLQVQNTLLLEPSEVKPSESQADATSSNEVLAVGNAYKAVKARKQKRSSL